MKTIIGLSFVGVPITFIIAMILRNTYWSVDWPYIAGIACIAMFMFGIAILLR